MAVTRRTFVQAAPLSLNPLPPTLVSAVWDDSAFTLALHFDLPIMAATIAAATVRASVGASNKSNLTTVVAQSTTVTLTFSGPAFLAGAMTTTQLVAGQLKGLTGANINAFSAFPVTRVP